MVRTCCFLYILTSKCVSSMFRPQRRALFEHFNLKKFSGAEVRWLYVLTSTCVSLCHSRMHFLKASTSESAPELRCLAPFDFECCFAPQTTCTFSTAQLPKVLRTCDVFNMFTSKCASCHNGVQSFISAPATLASLLFDPPEPQNIGKTQCFTTFLFAHFDLLSSDSFSSLTSSLLTLSLL